MPGFEYKSTRYYLDNPDFQSRQDAAKQFAQQRGQAVAAQIEKQNVAIAIQNEKYVRLLRETTQETMEADPRKWWDWWQGYIDSHPNHRIRNLQNALTSSMLQLPSNSIAVGTKVWTQTGRQPIESIMIGDQVLSQNPRTGELAYKSVLGVGRSIALTRRIDVDGEGYLAAEGLHMWQAGNGWWLTRDLDRGSRLHGLFGTAAVTRNAQMIEKPTVQLLVEDFHSFFVGDRAFLVHDTSWVRPTDAAIPGLPKGKPIRKD